MGMAGLDAGITQDYRLVTRFRKRSESACTTVFTQFLNAMRTNDWKLSRVPRKLLMILCNLTAHQRLCQLLARPKFAELTSKHPHLPFTYLRAYLSKRFTVSARCSAFIHHYSYLHAKLPDDLLSTILFSRLTLWEESIEAHRYSLTLGFSNPIRNEGELSISFMVNDIRVSLLSFTIVPGSLVGLDVEHAFLISRMQGVQGYFQQIRRATKAFNEVSPSLMLIAALQGVADAFGIRYSAAVSAVDQVSNKGNESVGFKAAYDEFWTSLGATKDASDIFHIPFPLPEKPLELVKQKYRARVKARRQFRQQVGDKVRRAVRLQGGDTPRAPSQGAGQIPASPGWLPT